MSGKITLFTMIVQAVLIHGTPTARADDIDDLLRQTDRALGRSTGDGDAKEAPADQPRRKRPKIAPATNPIQGAGAPGAQNEAPVPTSVFPGTDANTVQELTVISGRKEAQLRPDSLNHGVRIGGGIARLRGRLDLEKDDDRFRAHPGLVLPGFFAAYNFQLGKSRIVKHATLSPTGQLALSYVSGRATVDRSGVESEELDVRFSLASASMTIGVRGSFGRMWGVDILYGPAAELAVQVGAGNSDTTSGFFASDQVTIGVDRLIFGRLWLGLSFERRGNAETNQGKSGLDVIALSLNAPLSG